MEDYIEEIKRKDSVSFIAKKEKVITGFVISRLITTEYYHSKNSHKKTISEIEIYNLAVDKNCQREGIGTSLIQKIIEAGIKNNAACIWLEVRASNSAAISLYKKNQFEEICQRKNFYRYPQEDALVMKLEIFKGFKSLQKTAETET